MTADRAPVDAWLNDFFATFYALDPVTATFTGDHAYDHRLPDWSESGAGDALASLHDLLRRSDSSGDDDLPASAAIDLRLGRGFLRNRIRELESRHFHRGNPSLYTGEAVFGIISLFLTDFAPLSRRIGAAVERLEQIPALLAQGRQNVRAAPASWTGRAIRECRAALALLTQGIDALKSATPDARASFETMDVPAQRAATAFVVYEQWLRGDLLSRPGGSVGCGEELLASCLTDGHFIEDDADSIADYATARLLEAGRTLDARFDELNRMLPETSPAEARDRRTRMLELQTALAGLHATVDDYYGRYGEIAEDVRRIVEANDLLAWPAFPIRFVPQPAWLRAASPDLYFLSYRSPAAFGRPPVHDCYVTPIDKSMPIRRQRELLRATNDSVIKLNHVIHHGGIGHHLQNWYALDSASRIGRIAAIDGASRIAMSCGGTMAEGWACYATDLMSEFGALTALEQCAEQQTRVRMCARAVVDIRMHQGRWTLEQSAAFYEQQAAMSRDAAARESIRNSMFPGTALMYLAGTDAIHRLRHDIAAVEGEAFHLGRFHDELLSWGSIPVSIVAGEMLRARAAPEWTTSGSRND